MDGEEKKIFESIRTAIKHDPRTQIELAELIGCKQTFISAVKNGRSNPGRYYRRFCEVLGLDANTGLSIKDLANRSDKEPITIRGIVRRDLEAAPVVGGEVSMELPAVIELFPSEARLILTRRDTSNPYQVFEVIREEIGLGRATLPEGDREARQLLKTIRGLLDGFLEMREYLKIKGKRS